VPTSASRLLETEQESAFDEFMLKLNERCNTRAAYCRRMAGQFMDGPDNDVFDVPHGVAHLKMVLLRQVSHEAVSPLSAAPSLIDSTLTLPSDTFIIRGF